MYITEDQKNRLFAMAKEMRTRRDMTLSLYDQSCNRKSTFCHQASSMPPANRVSIHVSRRLDCLKNMLGISGKIWRIFPSSYSAMPTTQKNAS